MRYNDFEDFDLNPDVNLWRLIFWSGLIAGLSEITWVSFYCLATSTDELRITQQITETLFPPLLYSYNSLILGLVIHFTLSILLSIAFVRTLWLPFTRHYHKSITLLFGASLGMILWMLNCWVALPLINRSTEPSLPHTITFISDLIFGIGLAWSICIFQEHKRPGFIFSKSTQT